MSPAPPLPLSLVVFAYNEAGNVPHVLPEILRWLDAEAPPSSCIFVDDGSTDGTRRAAVEVLAGRPGTQVLGHTRNRGIGAALKTGVAAASLPWVTFLPCDGQIAPRSSGGPDAPPRSPSGSRSSSRSTATGTTVWTASCSRPASAR